MLGDSIVSERAQSCRGRPSGFDRKELVQQVIQLFWEHGYGGLSLNRIAKETGLTRASLYHAFGDKPSLFIEALESYLIGSPYLRMMDLAGGADSCFCCLEQYLLDVCGFICGDPERRGCMAVNCGEELLVAKGLLGSYIRSLVAFEKSCYEAFLSESIKNGEMPGSSNVHSLSLTILTFVRGLSTLSKLNFKVEDLEESCRVFVASLGWKKSCFDGSSNL